MQHINHKNHYGRLVGMIMLSFVAMYVLMYAMVNVFGNAYPNINQFYMAGLMSMPMMVIEMLLMGMMYKSKRLNWIIGGLSVVLLITFWLGIRFQIGVGDKQFLRSMIPHHAGAILMCEKASIMDPEIKELCAGIISGQQAEIDLMKAKLQDLKKKGLRI